jgi:Tfp pilus assembly protein FimV
MTTDPLLSIAEASRVLGISERTLRRVLRDPEIAARTLAKDRQTRTGRRRAILLSPELIAELSGRMCANENGGTNTSKMPADVAAVYEHLLAEREARIADLTAALEYEREQARLQAEALARAQTMLAAAAYRVEDRSRPLWRWWSRK